ncbi:putative mitochondrial protein [Senna tora]|uniref:Putative mitochondrial protein n=1 Tax=Senna tora TaxID=362788 RepID=A0A834SZC1_9FABA|nr:putative mitochondrial protein [Senna tora]
MSHGDTKFARIGVLLAATTDKQKTTRLLWRNSPSGKTRGNKLKHLADVRGRQDMPKIHQVDPRNQFLDKRQYAMQNYQENIINLPSQPPRVEYIVAGPAISTVREFAANHQLGNQNYNQLPHVPQDIYPIVWGNQIKSTDHDNMYNMNDIQCVRFSRMKLVGPAKKYWQTVQRNLERLGQPQIEWVTVTRFVNGLLPQIQRELRDLASGSLNVMRCLLSNPMPYDSWRRTSIFHTFMKYGNKVCKLVIDGGNSRNVVSTSGVARLGLITEPHPEPFRVAWVDKTSLPVTQQCRVPI